jgi:hypothetical protein
MIFLLRIDTDEVSHWLEGLFLSHDEPDFLGFLVSHQLAVAGSSLLPLFIPHSVEFASHFENAFLLLLSTGGLGCRNLNLLTPSWIKVHLKKVGDTLGSPV